MIRALLLKDLRLHGLAWALCWFLLIGAGLLSLAPRFRYGVPLLLCTVGLTVLIALLSIAYFATESTSGTESFLFGFPAPRRTVWLTRLVSVTAHAVLAAGLCLVTLRHAVATLPDLAQTWGYGLPEWFVLLGLGRFVPYVAAVTAFLGASCATMSQTNRRGWLLFLVSAALVAGGYAAVCSLSGTLPAVLYGSASIPAWLDWLVAAELTATSILAALAVLAAFCRTAPQEVDVRRRRWARTTVAAFIVLVAAALPFHLWANITTASCVTSLWPVGFSSDRNTLVMRGWASKLGRVFDNRFWLADLATGELSFLARGSDPHWLEDDTLTFRLPGFLGWPPYARVAEVSLSDGRVRPFDVPALRKAARLRPRASGSPEVHPETGDLLFARRRDRNTWHDEVWYMSRDGKTLRKIFSSPSAPASRELYWHPDGVGAYVTVTHAGDEGDPRYELWWVPIPGSQYGSSTASQRKPVKIHVREDYMGVGRVNISADGKWIYLWDRDRAGPPEERRILVTRFDGGARWEVPFGGDRRVSAAWSPTGARLAVMGFADDGQVSLAVCDPQTRASVAVADFHVPIRWADRLHRSLATWWSPDGSTLLVRILTLDDWPRLPRSPFQAVRRRIQWALYEVSVENGEVRQVCKPIQRERRLSAQGMLGSEGWEGPEWPTVVGYDTDEWVLLLEGKKLLRIDPETEKQATVLRW